MKKLIILIALFIFIIPIYGQDGRIIVTIDSFYIHRSDSTIKGIIIDAGDEWNWMKALYDTTYHFNHCPECNNTNSTEYKIEKQHNWVSWSESDNLIYYWHHCNNCGNIWIKRKVVRWDSDNKYRRNW